MAIRIRASVGLAKIESTSGIDATPTAGSNAILMENIIITPKPTIIATNEVTQTLDDYGEIVGGMMMDISFDVYVKGNASPGVTVPEWDPLMKASGWASTLTTAIPVGGPEACIAGGSTSVVNLGATAAATAELYQGMPLALSSAVSTAALAQGVTFIADYSAAKAATVADTLGGAPGVSTLYQIPANTLYAPASASIGTASIYVYRDNLGVFYKFVGCAGDVSFAFTAGGLGKMTFKFQGMFLSKTDIGGALPTPTYDSTRPPVWKGGVMSINRSAAQVRSLTLGMGNTISMPDDPNALEGVGPGVITRRNMKGSLDPLETTVATRDVMGDFRAGTRRIVHLRYGTAIGNRVALTMPTAQYQGQAEQDRAGLLAVNIPFEAVGQNSGAFLCLF